ncbi:MAG: hypothetical protein LBC53_02975 [Spirochaetaceae bacterium]|jgi:hypothetical protein|nr:hypothetical protein [Spirochaetaceae bacterium]
MKKIINNKKYILFVFLSCVFFASCNDPIFHQIELEVEPLQAKIPGSPSKIVSNEGADKLYTANGKLWGWDNKTDAWSEISTTFKTARDVAYVKHSNAEVLYALSVGGSSTKIYAQKQDANASNAAWAPIESPQNYTVQSIFGAYGATGGGAAKGAFFACASNAANEFAVYYIENPGDSLKPIDGFKERIFGAAFFNGKYYFAANNGVYQSGDLTAATRIDEGTEEDPGTKDKQWMNIVSGEVKGIPVLAATSRDGFVYLKNVSGKPSIKQKEDSYVFTSALCFWTGGDAFYLLCGIQGSSYTNGYREIKLTLENGVVKLDAYGQPAASVENTEKYSSTIGIRALNSIFMPAQPEAYKDAARPLVFASTQQNGLWSYRGIWNAAEK